MTPRPPFFVIGCVRSGTTMLRNLLRQEPDLLCPEETHFYRWSEPYRTRTYLAQTRNNAVLRKHREIDGVGDEIFARVVDASATRRELMWNYMKAYAAARGQDGANWFDKTPQNIYGLPLLIHDFPHARFVHLVRHPYNVAASLILGKVVAAPDVVAAANYWNEAVSIFNTLKPLIARRSIEISYEAFTRDPAAQLAALRQFLGFSGTPGPALGLAVHVERDQQKSVLSDADRAIIRRICGRWAGHYGYRLDDGEGEAGGGAAP